MNNLGWRELNTEKTIWERLKEDIRESARRKASLFDWLYMVACIGLAFWIMATR